MPRVHYVKKARKDQGNCYKCGTPIKAGDPYKWWKFGGAAGSRGPGGPKIKRCGPCPSPKQSELTRSPFRSTLYAAQEDYYATNWETAEDAADALRNYAEAVRGCAEIRTEAADNIVSGFGHETYVSENLRDEGQEVEGWADDIESKADEVAGLDPEDYEDEDGLRDAIEDLANVVEECPI
jgi:hypothetical protein